MNILDFKPASKFILTKDFVVETSDHRGQKYETVYPKNLVISIRNLRFKANGELSIRFVVVRSKPIIKLYYKDIPDEFYHRVYKWGSSTIYFTLRNKNFKRFLEEKPFDSFTDEYNKLTK